MINIRQVSLDTVLPLRQRYLRPNLSESQCRLNCDDHPQVIHFGAYNHDLLVGICTIAPEELPAEEATHAWRLRMMATDTTVRHQGFGKQLLAKVDDVIKSQAGECVWCNARIPAQGFYAKLGYQVVSEVFDIERIGPHCRMVKYL